MSDENPPQPTERNQDPPVPPAVETVDPPKRRTTVGEAQEAAEDAEDEADDD